jgi:outer membrane protein OmpA-like peptidoglycan-associated protein/uncharacterized protein YidB (DUF937 family)
MFDLLLKELAKRLNLGDHANGLLGMLLSLMFDANRGGFAGFIDRFRAKGLGDAVTSWLGNGENKVLSVAQLESVLGPQVLAQMASRLDLAPTSVATALGHLLPSVIDKLSPDGRLPTGAIVPEVAKPYLGAFADFAATAVLPETVATQAAQHTLTHGPGSASSSQSKLWLLLIPVLIAPLFFIKQCSHELPSSAPTVSAPPTTDAASAEPVAAETPPIVDPVAPALTNVTQAQDAAAALDKVITAETVDNKVLIDALNLMVVRFDSGTASIKAESADILEKAAAAIKKLPGLTLQIAGHTDNRGPAADNQKLSEARAAAVLARLASLGVDRASLSASGLGDTQPVADNATKEGRAKNRRIEFSVKG